MNLKTLVTFCALSAPADSYSAGVFAYRPRFQPRDRPKESVSLAALVHDALSHDKKC